MIVSHLRGSRPALRRQAWDGCAAMVIILLLVVLSLQFSNSGSGDRRSFDHMPPLIQSMSEAVVHPASGALSD